MQKPELLWRKGPNYAADAVVIANDKVCLIKRKSGMWALPGGFVDDGEDSLDAAKREALEETSLVLQTSGQLVFSGKVEDPRNSETRWIESDAYVFFTDQQPVTAADDAQDADWFSLDNLPELYGSHKTMVENALAFRKQQELRRQLETSTLTETRGGHMGYDYLLAESDAGKLFIKHHNDSHFTDSHKANHSRMYLKKELNTSRHLRRQQFRHLPNQHHLFDEVTLVMEALAEDDGWHWRLPRAEHRERYITDILKALSNLELVPYDKVVELEGIKPSIESMYEEGWKALSDPLKRQKVVQKMRSVQSRLSPASQLQAPKLIAELEAGIPTVNIPPLDALTHFSHHDARQANIAWHPAEGVKIVDWSWAGKGLPKADTTSFLIDLKKSGHDVRPYVKQYFNPEYALLLIGFWLGHSIWPTRTDDDTVRLHQVASALSAYELLGEV